MAAALAVRGLAKRYGAVEALAGVDLEVREGELVGLLYAGNGSQTYACPIDKVIAALTRDDDVGRLQRTDDSLSAFRGIGSDPHIPDVSASRQEAESDERVRRAIIRRRGRPAPRFISDELRDLANTIVV